MSKINDTSTKYSNILICLALTLITFAVFYQVCGFAFVNFDDIDYAYENPNIQSGITFNAVKWAFTTGFAANWHPLTWISHMLDWQLFGNNAGGHHLTNLIFHIANTLLLFIVLRQMTSALWQSAFVAALFAFHPLHVESVAWVSERKDVLSTFFWILTMWTYLRYVKQPNAGRYLLTLLTFALGLMSKPMLVTLPFVLLLLDYWPLKRFGRRTVFYLVLEKIPFFILSAASSIITFLVQQNSGTVMPLAAVSLKFRLCNALISYVKYIEKMFWPSRLAVFYPHPGTNVSIAYALISAALLLVATVLVIRSAKNHRYLFTGWFWYIGTILPVSGMSQAGGQAMADRYTYITLTGLFVIIAWGIGELLAKSPHRKIILWPVALIVLSALAICTYLQTRYWKDSITLYERAIKVTENNYIAHFNITQPLFEQGRVQEAIRHDYEALRINPDYVEALNGLGFIYTRLGRIDEAIPLYNKALQLDPSVNTYLNLGVALTNSGKLQEAEKVYEKILAIQPQNASARNDFGVVLCRLGKYDRAIEHFNKALQINPQYTDAKNNLNITLAEMQKSREENTEDAKE